MKIDFLEYLKDIEIFHNFCLPILEPKLEDVETFSVPDFHLQIYKDLLKDERLQLTVAPVGFAKSTLLKILALYEILIKKSNLYTLYVSSTDTKAVEHLGAIQKILKKGYFKNTFKYEILSLNTHEIIILYHKHEYKIEAVASGSDIAGKIFNGQRPSLIIADDLEDLEQAKSFDRTNKLQDWLLTILIARLPSVQEGKFRMINTVLSADSLTNRILGKSPNRQSKREFEDWHTYFYQALDKNDKSIWEERHPTKFLLKERELRPTIFAKNYMNEPLNDEDKLFAETDVGYYDYVNWDDIPELFAHYDTTHTAKSTSDFFCFVLAGKNIKDNKIYILDFLLSKTHSVQMQRQLIVTNFLKYPKLKRATYDKVSNDGFELDVVNEARAVNVFLSPSKFEGVKFGSDKYTHILRHEHVIKSKTVVFPSRHKQINEAISQLTSFTVGNVKVGGNADDFVDGLSGVLDNFLEKQDSTLEYFKLLEKHGL